jgi:hypothetical protein
MLQQRIQTLLTTDETFSVLTVLATSTTSDTFLESSNNFYTLSDSPSSPDSSIIATRNVLEEKVADLNDHS